MRPALARRPRPAAAPTASPHCRMLPKPKQTAECRRGHHGAGRGTGCPPAGRQMRCCCGGGSGLAGQQKSDRGRGRRTSVGQAACGRCRWMLGFTHACSMRDGLTRAPARWPAERQGAVRAPVPAGARRRARVRARDAAPPAQAGHPEDRPGRAHARGAEPVRAPACCLAGKRAGTGRSLCGVRPALGLR